MLLQVFGAMHTEIRFFRTVVWCQLVNVHRRFGTSVRQVIWA